MKSPECLPWEQAIPGFLSVSPAFRSVGLRIKVKGTPDGCPLLYEKNFSVIDFLILVARLTRQLEAELIQNADIHLGEHDRGVRLATAEFFQLFQGLCGIRVARGVHRERNQHLVGVESV